MVIASNFFKWTILILLKLRFVLFLLINTYLYTKNLSGLFVSSVDRPNFSIMKQKWLNWNKREYNFNSLKLDERKKELLNMIFLSFFLLSYWYHFFLFHKLSNLLKIDSLEKCEQYVDCIVYSSKDDNVVFVSLNNSLTFSFLFLVSFKQYALILFQKWPWKDHYEYFFIVCNYMYSIYFFAYWIRMSPNSFPLWVLEDIQFLTTVFPIISSLPIVRKLGFLLFMKLDAR